MKPSMFKVTIFAICVVSAFGSLSAQKPVWQSSPGHTQVPIWPGAVHDPQPVAGPEFVETDPKFLIAGKPVVGISNVTQPTMTVYSPTGNNTGAAVVVFPGGGYQGLAIDLEGTEVCDWLTPRGITCVLLKYRVTDVGPYPKSGPYPESPMALEDAQRTVGLVRFHAAEWHIDPHKIGVLGFSAGGHLSALVPLIGEVLGVKAALIEYHSEGKRRSLRLGDVADAEVEGLPGQDGSDVTVANIPFAAVPGVPLVVAKSKQMRFSDYGLKWEVSNKNGYFAPFAYQSA